MTFNQKNIQRIKDAFENISTSKWEAGDAALAEIPRQMGRGSDVSARAETLAAAAGVAATSLREYRDQAYAWPVEERIPEASWSVHREVQGREDRVALIQSVLAEHGKVTVTLVRQAMGKPAVQNGKEAIEEAAAKAKAEAEAKAAAAAAAAEKAHQKALADALERQKREAALAEAKRAAEAAAKIRAEEQAKAKAAAERELAELRAKLAESAKAAQFDLSTLTADQKSQIMTLLANDPAQAKEWFAARDAERKRKLDEQEKAQKEAAAKKRQQMEEREARQAAERARKDYDASPLKAFLGLVKAAKACQEQLRNKGVSFDHILVSGMTAQEWIVATEAVEDIAVEFRESIFDANATKELSDIVDEG